MAVDKRGLQAVLAPLLADRYEWLKTFKEVLHSILGDASITLATKTQVGGLWHTQVHAFVDPAAGEWIGGLPQATLYKNNNIVDGPLSMQIFGFESSGLYVGNFYGTYPEPNFAKIEVVFMDATYNSTTKTDVAEIAAP